MIRGGLISSEVLYCKCNGWTGWGDFSYHPALTKFCVDATRVLAVVAQIPETSTAAQDSCALLRTIFKTAQHRPSDGELRLRVKICGGMLRRATRVLDRRRCFTHHLLRDQLVRPRLRLWRRWELTCRVSIDVPSLAFSWTLSN